MIDFNQLLDLKKLTKLEIGDVNTNEKLIDIVASMTQLRELDFFELYGEYNISSFLSLQNLMRIWLSLDVSESDQGLNFSQMQNLEEVLVSWCPNITQLVHLKKLQKLTLQEPEGSRKTNEVPIDFLNELGSLKELTIPATLLPNDRIVDMKGMTNLMYVHIILSYQSEEREKTWPGCCSTYRGKF